MHKIESRGATADNRFTEGDPVTGTLATELSASFMNAVQDELVKVIEAAGLTLQTAGTETGDQLLAALQAMGLGGYATAAEAQALTSLTKLLSPGRLADAFKGGNQSLTGAGYQVLPGGLILQWGGVQINAGESAVVTASIAFPNATLAHWAQPQVVQNSTTPIAFATDPGTGGNQFTVRNRSTISSGNSKWFVLGY